jgi:hypothetical protein
MENSRTDELNKNNHVSFEESTKAAETSAANNSTLLKKKKINQKQVKLKSVENIDTLSTTNKSNDVNLKLSSKSTSLASVNSTRSSSIFSYSYVILIASFFSYMLASLLSSCFGVFFESMSTDLNWSRSQVAFIGSLLTSLQDLAGPISSALTNHYGCRRTAMFGGLICALGIIGSAYTTNFWLFGFLMGGVSGFGGSLVLVSSVVVVTYYFEDKPSFAAGFTISGASMGQSIFTMIIIKLNEVYGRSGCFLILGGILLNIVVCGALFRPHPWELEDDDDEDDEEEEDEDDEDEEDDEEDEDEEEDDDYENMDEVESENELETETKQIRKIATKESNLNESEEKKKENNAPMATNDDDNNDDEQAEIELYFHDLFLMNEKNENQVFYSDQMNVDASGSNGVGGVGNVTTSSQYLSNRKDFQSDPCLNSNNENEMPSIGVSVISIASIQQQQQQQQHQLQQHQLKNKQNFHKNQMFSYFDRHHSLQQIPTDHFNLNSNTSNSNLKQLAKSDLILKNFTSAYSLMMSKQQIIDDQQEEEEELRLDNAEFVLLDTEEMITDCNSNLMLSSSQTAIYLPFLNDQPNLNEEQLNKIDLKREKSKSNILYNNNNSEACNETIEILANDTKKMMSQRNSYSEMKQSEKDETTERQIKSKISRPTRISTFLNRFTNFFSKKSNKQELPLKVTETPVPPVTPPAPPVQQQQQVTDEANNQLITKTNKSKHIVTLDPVNYKLIINNRNQSDKTGPRFIIARCNCRQRNLQNLQKRTEKQQRRNKLRSNSVNIASNTTNNNEIIDLPETNEKTSQSQSIINQTSVNMDINKKQMNRNSTPTNFDKNQFKFKHFPNCPISKLNRLKNMHIVQNQNSNHHHHHYYNHHLQASMLVNQAKRNNLYYVPSLFQNSYRFPLHFKNVYYYKSLINLNMRLKNLKSHGNHTATLAGVLNLKDFETNQPHIHLNNHHHHHHHYSHHHQQQQQTNNVSFSCPNLNPNQFFIVNKNVISFKRLNEQYGGQIVPIKGIRRPMQMLTKNDNNNTITSTTTTTTNNTNTPINNSNTNTKLNVQNLVQTKNLEFTSNLKDVSKVLNAGSIVISSSREMPTKKRLLNLNQTSGGKKLSTSSKQQQSDKIKKSNESLICVNDDYNDNIQDTLLRKSKDKKSSIIEKQDEEDEEDEDDEEEDEDEDDDEDEEDDEEEETCDNCFTRTKIGYYMYKNIWKPMINSFKFIFYSICENLKLFRFFKFSVFAFCNFILSFFYESPFIFINSYMVNNNLSEEQAGSVTIAVGIVCIFSSSNLIFSK